MKKTLIIITMIVSFIFGNLNVNAKNHEECRKDCETSNKNDKTALNKCYDTCYNTEIERCKRENKNVYSAQNDCISKADSLAGKLNTNPSIKIELAGWCEKAEDSTKKSKCIDCVKNCGDTNTTGGNICAQGCESNVGISHSGEALEYQGEYVQCGDSGAFPSALPKLSRILVLLVEILVPITLIIFGMLDFTKAVASNDSDFLEKAKKKFMRRLISACAVFFVFVIVKLALSGFVSDESSGAVQCADCFINNASSCKPATYTSPRS